MPRPRSGTERDEKIDRLERRITKLVKALEKSENHLAKISVEGNVDPGLSSRYRVVQGLSGNEEDCELKKSLLKGILEVNLVLQRGGNTATRPESIATAVDALEHGPLPAPGKSS